MLCGLSLWRSLTTYPASGGVQRETPPPLAQRKEFNTNE
jgi:hypothetical protein